MESINRESPHTFLKRKMVECELAWEQCRNIDRLLLEIMEEKEEEEAASKEENDQLEYEEKIYELRDASKKYLDNQKTEPSSVAKDVKDTKDAAREIAKPVEETVKEISETIDPMENTHNTRSTENVHFRRAPFQSTVIGNRSAAKEAMSDDWIRQLAGPTLKEPEEFTVPAQKPFNGKLPDQEEGVDRKDYIGNHPMIDTRRRGEQKIIRNHALRPHQEKGHIVRVCRFKKRCGKGGCNRVHHPELHENVEQKVNYQVSSKE